MRYSEEHKAAVRTRIVSAAAAELRRAGLTGVSIPAIMRRLGMTHGGFYAHFADRDALVAEAVRAAGEQTAVRVLDVEGGSVDQMLAAYLSPGHAAHPEQGCVLAALGAEGVHTSGSVRRSFAEVARGFLRLVDRRLRPRARGAAPGDEALATASRMIGALILARLVDDQRLSRRILAAGRRGAGAARE